MGKKSKNSSRFSHFPFLVKSIFSRKPNYLILFVTARCNAKCAHCFNWKKNECSNDRSEITLHEFGLIAQNFSSLEYLTISGGEPFLRDDLEQIIKTFILMSRVRVVSIPTNSTRPKVIERVIKKLVSEFPEVLFNINLSIDGIGENHDKIRGVEHNFDLVLESYKKLKTIQKNHPNLSIQSTTVYSSANETTILDTLDWITLNLKINNPTIALIRGDSRDSRLKQIHLKNYIRAIKFARNQVQMNQLKDLNIFRLLLSSVKILGWELITNVALNHKIPLNCSAGKKLLVIDDIGDVFPCELLPSLGNLRTEGFSLKSILNSNKTKQVLKKVKENHCSCTFECAIQNSIVSNPRTYYLVVTNFIYRLKSGLNLLKPK